MFLLLQSRFSCEASALKNLQNSPYLMLKGAVKSSYHLTCYKEATEIHLEYIHVSDTDLTFKKVDDFEYFSGHDRFPKLRCFRENQTHKRVNEIQTPSPIHQFFVVLNLKHLHRP